MESVRGTPDSLVLSEEKFDEIVAQEAKKELTKKPPRRHLPILKKKHKEIEEKLRAGVTKRVIHTQLGIARNTLEKYIQDCPDLQEAWEDAQNDLLDLSEEIVGEIATMDCSMNETENGSFPRFDGRSLSTKFNAAKLRLERLGSKRGWNPKIETNEVGNGGNRTPIIFMGELSEALIAESEAEVRRINEDAIKGLEGIPRG